MGKAYLVQPDHSFSGHFFRSFDCAMFENLPGPIGYFVNPYHVFTDRSSAFGPFEYNTERGLWLPKTENFWYLEKPELIEFYRDMIKEDRLQIVTKIPEDISRKMQQWAMDFVVKRDMLKASTDKLIEFSPSIKME